MSLAFFCNILTNNLYVIVCLYISSSKQQMFANAEGNWKDYKKAELVWRITLLDENSNICFLTEEEF